MIRIFSLRNLFTTFKKWFLLLFLALFLGLFYYLDLFHYLNLKTIRAYQVLAMHWATDHYEATVGIYISVFTLLIACGIPCATLLTLLGGFLFGAEAFFYALIGTTLGGMILYFAVKSAFGAPLAKRSTGWIKRIEQGFQQNAFSYILMMRLMPIFPCWISNISAGVLNIPLKTFVIATVIGIVPATFIYAMAGRSLDKLLTADQVNVSLVFMPSIFFPLLGLAILSLFPIFYKRMKKL